MSVHVDPAHIVWDVFDCLEPPREEWREQFAYWEDYVEKFFRSNGMDWDPADSNVEAWLMAPDRAPFAAMVDALLPRLAERTALGGTDAILLAHWLPDLHLGTSVTNFAMHRLGLEDCFGLAVSDRGLSAPFFAFDCLVKYLAAGRRRGLLVVTDQKHLMYRSDLVRRLEPLNSACILALDLEAREGLRYAGYARADAPPEGAPLAPVVEGLRERLGLSPDTVPIGPPDLAPGGVETDGRLVCSAPFAALAEAARTEPRADRLLLCRDARHVTALGFGGAS